MKIDYSKYSSLTRALEKFISEKYKILESEGEQDDENTNDLDRGVPYWTIEYKDEERQFLLLLNLKEMWVVKHYQDEENDRYGWAEMTPYELKFLDRLGFHLGDNYKRDTKQDVEDWF